METIPRNIDDQRAQQGERRTIGTVGTEIRYWAGVIMRNACRRCRKAKYCGKECQSKAWAEGHRFWCSARKVVARSNASAHSSAIAVATKVEVPTQRGITIMVTRAWVNIAGGMTRRKTNIQQQQQIVPHQLASDRTSSDI
ncbi:hypothetical protein RSOLAG22IIIB_07449 [Rhizoctonia solani]|uniref:MYND-type domain-containing protein n=1 Tax=Rhizoctonia solani TaxID=456999 RepID=A0A0K6FMW7_9AGAM|nr:hypothetical protein RSOLAG22IIIB_07449 [Rhizoctonia solani]